MQKRMRRFVLITIFSFGFTNGVLAQSIDGIAGIQSLSVGNLVEEKISPLKDTKYRGYGFGDYGTASGEAGESPFIFDVKASSFGGGGGLDAQLTESNFVSLGYRYNRFSTTITSDEFKYTLENLGSTHNYLTEFIQNFGGKHYVGFGLNYVRISQKQVQTITDEPDLSGDGVISHSLVWFKGKMSAQIGDSLRIGGILSPGVSSTGEYDGFFKGEKSTTGKGLEFQLGGSLTANAMSLEFNYYSEGENTEAETRKNSAMIFILGLNVKRLSLTGSYATTTYADKTRDGEVSKGWGETHFLIGLKAEVQKAVLSANLQTISQSGDDIRTDSTIIYGSITIPFPM